ncbi:type IV secretory system conjugative DNA transfer family protein [uncultured Enorma sp.]|uniref:type IV secretory system conjugative DNA transfer family protein n=1 Tax=uncultured Enorma sp. TaxID=1714346 RepID=UPI002804E8F0|nr:type IV secretory system conjugative DNA transfer family protein [uncultured Enorma sp.]
MSVDSSNAADRAAYQGKTIVGRNRTIETDSFQTGINNNMLVIGPSGAGKTRHVLKPNLLQMGSSFIVLDTKGTLCREMGAMLAGAGYAVECLDFANICEESKALPADVERVGYDPLAFIRRDAHGCPNQQDILSIAVALCPVESMKDPFWDRAAANLLAVLIAYVMEELPREEQTFAALVELAEHLNDGATFRLLDDLEVSDPDSLASSMYLRYASTRDAEKMNASIIGIIAEKLMCLGFDGALRLYTASRQVDFARFGHERRALFVTMSDIDRALDPLTSLFVDQAFKALLREADRCPGGRMPVPVRLFLDDFANLYINKIDDLLAVVRSREIWVTLLLQSVNQLEARYGRPRAMSIVGNCDTQLVLGFQDLDTAQCFAERADRMPKTLLETAAGRAWLFVRGKRAEEVESYRLEEHPRFEELVAAASAPLEAPAREPIGSASDEEPCPFAFDDEIPF